MIKFTIPVKTVSEANSHTHWRIRAKRAKSQRTAAYLVGLKYKVRSLIVGDEWNLTIVMTRVSPRSLDSDNLAGSAKHVRDGLADAMGIDDRTPRITWIYEQRRGKQKEYAVDVEIRDAA